MTRSYPAYRVVRYCRRSRRALEVPAAGLTMDAARDLAAELRDAHRQHEADYGFRTETMPLEDQVELLAAGESMRALRMAA